MDSNQRRLVNLPILKEMMSGEPPRLVGDSDCLIARSNDSARQCFQWSLCGTNLDIPLATPAGLRNSIRSLERAALRCLHVFLRQVVYYSHPWMSAVVREKRDCLPYKQ